MSFHVLVSRSSWSGEPDCVVSGGSRRTRVETLERGSSFVLVHESVVKLEMNTTKVCASSKGGSHGPLFFKVLRRRQRGFSLTKAHYQCWCVYDDERGCQDSSTSHLHSHAKNQSTCLIFSASKTHSKGGACPRFDLQKNTQQRGSQSK